MQQKQVMLVALVLAFFSMPVLAEEAFDPAKKSCPGMSTLEMLHCAGNEYGKVDKELNELYAEFVASAGKDNTQAIKNAQRAWIHFKEKFCGRYAFFESNPGSLAQLVHVDCLSKITGDRIREIRRIKAMKAYGIYSDSFARILKRLDATGRDRYMRSLATEVADLNGSLSRDVTSDYKVDYNDKAWKQYIGLTCDFSSTYIRDERKVCEARINHYLLERVTEILAY